VKKCTPHINAVKHVFSDNIQHELVCRIYEIISYMLSISDISLFQ